MTDEFEKALQRALQPHNPPEEFSARVAARIDSNGRAAARTGRFAFLQRRTFRSRWLPVALAACLIAAVGIVQMRQHALEAMRANEARSQLLQALRIASDNVNIVRAAVAREENPDS